MIGTALALLMAPAAAGAAEGPLLWGGLRAGMTKAEVKALYPKYRGEISPGCPVEVLTRYEKRRLVSIVLLGRDKLAPCSKQVIAATTARLGAATVAAATQSSMPISAGGMVTTNSFQRTDMVWQAAGHRVTLALMGGDPMGYNLIFTVRTDGKLY